MRGQDRAGLDASGDTIEMALDALSQPDSVMGDVEHSVQARKHAALPYLYRVWHNRGAPRPSSLRHAGSCLRSASALAKKNQCHV
ncbi:hypothetical protein GGR54DRAFT_619854 [Hypoxylon sp. NC1633]|nr:hypothetical protein GGR54DRAFT_619854 [Hypoxylon sp. NC1633]